LTPRCSHLTAGVIVPSQSLGFLLTAGVIVPSHSLSEQGPEASRQLSLTSHSANSACCVMNSSRQLSLTYWQRQLSLLRVRSHRSDSGRQLSLTHWWPPTQLATILVNHDIQHLFAMPAVHQNKFLLTRCSACQLSSTTEVADRALHSLGV